MISRRSATAVNLDEFIVACANRGKLESQGSFSVDSIAALRKTLSSSLPEPHYYLFQILQGLICAGATDIKVAIGRRENKVSFEDPEGGLANIDALADSFAKGLSVSSSKPEDLIMSGLVTSLGAHISSAEFHYDDEKVNVTVMGIKRHTRSGGKKTKAVVLKRALQKGLAFSWSRIWGARKEEFRVRKSFEHAPSPLHIAGLATTPRSGWRRSAEENTNFALLEVAILDKARPKHRGEDQSGIKPLASNSGYYKCDSSQVDAKNSEIAVAPNLLMLALDESGQKVKGTILEEDWHKRSWTIVFTNSNEEMSDILFVRNGFAIERLTQDLGIPGIQVVAPADDLQVDATGYKLVRNKHFEARLAEVKEQVSSIKDTYLEPEELTKALKLVGRDPEEIFSELSWL